MKILFVDDSKSVHAFVKEILKDTGLTLVHALSVDEALQNHIVDSNIELMFLDWDMPGTLGIDGLPLFRKKFSDLPIIMLTSKNDIENIELALSRGATDYLMKPFTADLIKERIQLYTSWREP